MSLESQEKARQSSDYDEAYAEKNPAKLWTIIKTSHMQSTHGVGVFDQLRARDTYNSLRQGSTESLSQFKRQTTEAIDVMRSVNETAPSDAAQATDFIHRLDDRHQDLKDGLLNAVTLGTAKAPDTLVEAHNLAVQYRVPMGQSPSTITNPIFMAMNAIAEGRASKVDTEKMASKPSLERLSKPEDPPIVDPPVSEPPKANVRTGVDHQTADDMGPEDIEATEAVLHVSHRGSW